MLTDSKIKAATIKEKDYKLSDSGGLFLQIKTNGSKYWRLKYRFAGKEKLLSIGVYPKVSLASARKHRDTAKDQLKDGLDPSLVKKQEKDRKHLESVNTFSAVATEWHSKQIGRWSDSTAKRQQALLDKDINPYLGDRVLREIETFELVGCLNRIVDRGALETAHKARQVINQICRYAKQTGRIKHNPASDLAGTIPAKKPKHMAAITVPEDFGKLLVSIDSYSGTHIIRTALRLAPLLFQRPGELCSMEWSEIDIDNAIWIIPRSKKKERNQIEGDHIVPLSSQALELILDIKPLTGRSKFVFPNQRNHDAPIRTESLNKALRIIGYDTKQEQCAHGFRASARTMLDEQLQLRIDWIEHQLAHKVRDALGSAYNRTKHLPERQTMMQKWANYLDNLKKQTLAGNVISASFQKDAS